MVTSSEDGSTINQDTIALEHPSPVSVLDASLYRDDEASPVKQITTSLKGKVSVTKIMSTFCWFKIAKKSKHQKHGSSFVKNSESN